MKSRGGETVCCKGSDGPQSVRMMSRSPLACVRGPDTAVCNEASNSNAYTTLLGRDGEKAARVRSVRALPRHAVRDRVPRMRSLSRLLRQRSLQRLRGRELAVARNGTDVPQLPQRRESRIAPEHRHRRR